MQCICFISSWFQLEREFLSNADSKQRLPEILQEILTKLNMCGHCSIPMSKWFNSKAIDKCEMNNDICPVYEGEF